MEFKVPLTRQYLMQNLNDMFPFAKVIEHGGFTAASKILDIPKSRLSRRIALLEAGLGVKNHSPDASN
ncbi:LysR family transcriptional regulator [Serratia marcescens]|uniref:LysR family transcriptional regulator n=1 Tax=Serratia marcescens TaxID=615 RepID=UPI00396C4318